MQLDDHTARFSEGLDLARVYMYLYIYNYMHIYIYIYILFSVCELSPLGPAA